MVSGSLAIEVFYGRLTLKPFRGRVCDLSCPPCRDAGSLQPVQERNKGETAVEGFLLVPDLDSGHRSRLFPVSIPGCGDKNTGSSRLVLRAFCDQCTLCHPRRRFFHGTDGFFRGGGGMDTRLYPAARFFPDCDS